MFLFFDIDGTLANDNGVITRRTHDAISAARARGAKVVLCTGRHLAHVMRLEPRVDADYVIYNSGGGAYDIAKSHVMFEHFIPNAAIRQIWDVVNGSGAHIKISVDQDNITDPKDPNVFLQSDKIVQMVIAHFEYDKVLKMMSEIGRIEGVHIPHRHKKLIDPKYVDKEYAKIIYFDVSAKGVTKQTGIEELLKYADAMGDDTIAFGDSDNDISMFLACKRGVAMGNAIDELKAVATDTIDTNNRDGVAKFLEKLEF
jgi:Cof subfamily protein (haloacid dehalogenase superfamily)